MCFNKSESIMPEQSHAIDHNGGHTLLPAYFGEFGGQYVPELLIPALDQLERAFVEAMDDPSFREELAGYLRDYLGRPTPLTECSNLPLPGAGKGKAWHLAVRTYGESAHCLTPGEEERLEDQETFLLPARSIVVLLAKEVPTEGKTKRSKKRQGDTRSDGR